MWYLFKQNCYKRETWFDFGPSTNFFTLSALLEEKRDFQSIRSKVGGFLILSVASRKWIFRWLNGKYATQVSSKVATNDLWK